MQYISWIMTAISITATIANAFQKRWCFIVWLFTNSFWCIYDIWIGSYGQAVMFAVYFVISVIGLRNWKKKGDNKLHLYERTYVDPKTGKEEKYTYYSLRQILKP